MNKSNITPAEAEQALQENARLRYDLQSVSWAWMAAATKVESQNIKIHKLEADKNKLFDQLQAQLAINDQLRQGRAEQELTKASISIPERRA